MAKKTNPPAKKKVSKIKKAVAKKIKPAQALAFSGELREGSQGEAVEVLQAKLGLMEHDGHMCQVTTAAVIKFQEEHDLKADGQVGPKTWDRIFQA